MSEHFSGELLFLIALRFLCLRKRRSRVCFHWGSFFPNTIVFLFFRAFISSSPNSLTATEAYCSTHAQYIYMPPRSPTTYQRPYNNYHYWLGETIYMKNVNYIGSLLIWPGSQIWPSLQRKRNLVPHPGLVIFHSWSLPPPSPSNLKFDYHVNNSSLCILAQPRSQDLSPYRSLERARKMRDHSNIFLPSPPTHKAKWTQTALRYGRIGPRLSDPVGHERIYSIAAGRRVGRNLQARV